MKIRALALAAAATMLIVTACEDDPVSNGAGEPAFLSVSVKTTYLGPEDVLGVTAYVADAQGARLPIEITANASDPSIVAVSDVTYLPELQETHFVLAAGSRFGTGQVIFSAGGLTDTASVRVVPFETMDAYEPNSDDPANPPTLTLPVDEVLSLNETDVDDFFYIEVANTTTFEIELDWDGQADDLDFIIWTPALDLVDASMATGSHPERGEVTLDPGTYLIQINNFTCTDQECGARSWTLYHLTIQPVSGPSD